MLRPPRRHLMPRRKRLRLASQRRHGPYQSARSDITLMMAPRPHADFLRRSLISKRVMISVLEISTSSRREVSGVVHG
jgi:hypothetical protein